MKKGSLAAFFIASLTPRPAGVVINNTFWLCLIVSGFESYGTGRDCFLRFLVPPYGAQSNPSSMKADFYCQLKTTSCGRGHQYVLALPYRLWI
ncbi:hypothetical protein [[Erwinia] mediterraneensis]|uniref:hypothetical protein n=1 Tax=[Erwinia] mediterraneensis TaxID=2161819 RepID=UPI001030790E|nr:hypothetical protein [[Erwinia] mediterraneensis]